MDWLRLKRVTAPADSMLTVEEAKRHLYLMHDQDDAYVEHLIEVATGFIEGSTGAGVPLAVAQWVLTMDHLPRCFDIDLCPVRSIDSVTVDGETIPPDLYSVDLDSVPARVKGHYLPQCRSDVGRVKVTFTAGYDVIPADLKHAALMLVSHLYENREAVSPDDLKDVPFSVTATINRYRAY